MRERAAEGCRAASVGGNGETCSQNRRIIDAVKPECISGALRMRFQTAPEWFPDSPAARQVMTFRNRLSQKAFREGDRIAWGAFPTDRPLRTEHGAQEWQQLHQAFSRSWP